MKLSTFERMSLYLNAKALAEDHVSECPFKKKPEGDCLPCERERYMKNVKDRND